jgi:DNA-binding response OmpR family regulator
MRPIRRHGVVLLLEPDATTRDAYAGYLRWAGFIVAASGTGAEAVTHFDETPPDVVVLDMSFPDAEGHDRLEQIVTRSRADHVPVLVMTTRDLGAKPRGARVVLRKPVAPEALLSTVHRLSEARRHRRRAETDANPSL